MKNRIMSFLLIIALMFINGCIGYTKHYKWEPTEQETEEIIERAAQKMAETEKSQK